MSDHRTQINVELKQLLRHLQNEASKQKNQTTIWKRARIAKKPSWDAKNIWGKSQSPFCYMHLALALEPASPEICQCWNGDVFIDVGQTQVARMANVAGKYM